MNCFRWSWGRGWLRRDHVLLQEALRREAHDRVHRLSDLGPPHMCPCQENSDTWHLVLCTLQNKKYKIWFQQISSKKISSKQTKKAVFSVPTFNHCPICLFYVSIQVQTKVIKGIFFKILSTKQNCCNYGKGMISEIVISDSPSYQGLWYVLLKCCFGPDHL